MENNDYLCGKSFAELPGWFKQLETFFRPVLENELNELRSQVRLQISAESQVRNEGIELAIQRYGLRPTLDTDQAVPSTSQACEPESKRLRLDQDTEDVLVSALRSAIADKGLMSMPTR